MKRLLPLVLLLSGCVTGKVCRARVAEARLQVWAQCDQTNMKLNADDKAKTERLLRFNQIDKDGRLINGNVPR